MSTETHSYVVEGRRIWMSLPYGSPVKDDIKYAGAHWDSASKRWWIGTVARDVVIPIMEEAKKLDTAELVTVVIKLDDTYQTVYGDKQTLSLDGVPLVTRYGRDGCPRLDDNVTLVNGRIRSRGGSRNNPWTEWSDDAAVLVEVAAPVAERWVEQGMASYPETVAADLRNHPTQGV